MTDQAREREQAIAEFSVEAAKKIVRKFPQLTFEDVLRPGLEREIASALIAMGNELYPSLRSGSVAPDLAKIEELTEFHRADSEVRLKERLLGIRQALRDSSSAPVAAPPQDRQAQYVLARKSAELAAEIRGHRNVGMEINDDIEAQIATMIGRKFGLEWDIVDNGGRKYVLCESGGMLSPIQPPPPPLPEPPQEEKP